MVVSVFDTNTVQASRFATLSANDEGFVTEGTLLVRTGGDAFSLSTGGALNVFGAVSSNGTVTIDTSSSDNSVFVGETGSILNSGDSANGYTVNIINSTDGRVTNYGTITGASGIAATSIGDHQIINAGNISSSTSGSFNSAIFLLEVGSGSGISIENSGTISGATPDTGSASVDPTSNAIYLNDYATAGGTVTLNNTGLITGRIALGTDADTITNIGTIRGGVDMGDGANRLDNAGTMAGAVTFGDDNDTFVNSGTLQGTVFTGTGFDIVTNYGTITDVVDLGTNSGSYTGFGDATAFLVRGSAEADRMEGGDARDEFLGNDGQDTLIGNGGEDDLSGGNGADFLFGGDGDDQLAGDGALDRIFGGNGNDVIRGGDDLDILRGEDGNDVIFGDAGRDVSFGGAGRDRFVFSNSSDSVSGSSTRDAIRDFVRGEDFIDLEAIAGGGLRYVGTSALSGTGPEVRHVTTVAGSSVVRIDVDGDGTRDMEILVQFTPTLTEDDFLL